jgi:L-ascorbate metabolism protein UlaG (beta-lactamase superfamily)
MALIHEVYQPELAMPPIGDHHTMGPLKAATATRLLNVRRVIPMHYGVTPGSDRAPAAFRDALDAIGLDQVETIEMRQGSASKGLMTRALCGSASSTTPLSGWLNAASAMRPPVYHAG